jgi:hypothetical protein
MSPPIFTPDGSEVSEIVLPDGERASEVVAPDGSVVFEGPLAGGAVYQWNPATFSTGDSTWTDDLQGEVMDITGNPQSVTLANGNPGIQGDGNDDVGLADIAPELLATSFSVEWEIDQSLDLGHILGVRESGGSAFFVSVNGDESVNEDLGNFAVSISSGGAEVSDSTNISPSTNPNFDDGNTHKVTFIANDTTADDYEIIIDGSNVSVSLEATNNPSPGQLSVDVAYFANNDFQFGSGPRLFSDSALGLTRWHDQAITRQTI